MADISKITLPNNKGTYDIKDAKAYRLGATVRNKNTSLNQDPVYISLIPNKKTLEYQTLIRAVGGAGDVFYSAYQNPNLTVECSYEGVNNIHMSTLFSPGASSTILVPITNLSTDPFIITVTKESNIGATDVMHLALFEHTLGNTAARLTDYKVELLTTGSTASSGEYTWQTVYQRSNVSDKINGLTIALNTTNYAYLYFKGLRFTVTGATPITTQQNGWGYNCFDLSLFQLVSTRPDYTSARAIGALDIHGGEVYGPVTFYRGISGNGASLTNLNADNISSGTVPVGRGGTGQTSAQNAMNAFVNALPTDGTTPVDADYYVSQHVGGGTSTTTYRRRPMSALWEYVKGKISSVLGLTATTYAGSSAKTNGHTVNKDVPSDAVFTDTTYSDATQSAHGLMSSSDKTKLDGIAEGATANAGTITGINMNGVSKGTSGVVDLGTVLTSHQDISGKADKSSVGNSRVWYASCSTAAATKIKTISLAGLASLTVGDQFVVYFANAQTYNGAPALQVNDIAAAGIRRLGGSNAQRYEWSAGEILHFVWNGSYFVIVDAGLASTTYFGYVKLSSAVNSTSEELAATPKAVKLAYDKAPPTFTTDDNGKRLMIVDGAMQWSESEGENLLGLSVNTLKAAESGTIVSLTVNQLVAKT